MTSSIPVPLPTFDPTAPATSQQLLDLLIESRDTAPRELFDACVGQGEAMVDVLAALFDHIEAVGLEGIDDGPWWAQLHGLYILGRLSTETAGQLLVRALVLTDQLGDPNLSDWVAGDWAHLFANKPASVLAQVRALVQDRSLDWYTRIQAPDVLLAAAMRAGVSELDAELDWLAAQVTDPEEQDADFRIFVGSTMMGFPRERHYELLQQLVREQQDKGQWNISYDQDELDRAFSCAEDQPEWVRRGDPWGFYDAAEIEQRQARWRDEDARKSAYAAAPAVKPAYAPAYVPPVPVETYVRATTKIGRNDPCPCGSGKKYKKCCMNLAPGQAESAA